MPHPPRRLRSVSGCLFVVVLLALTVDLVAQTVPGRKPVSMIVTGGTVVTMDGARRVLAPGAVAVEGNRIAAVGTPDEIARDFTAPEVIQAEGTIVLPGLINTHGHAAMGLFPGLADDMALMDWLNRYI